MMATTQDRLRQSERLEELWKQPSAEPERTRIDFLPAVRRASRESPDWSHPLLIAWVAIVVALYIFEPRPSDPTATPLWGTIVLLAFTYALLASMIGLASRRPWGLGASALAGGLGMVVAGACAATGHHAGAWWIVEALAFTGLAAGSLAALHARH
jgi:hypothetical protein